MKKFVIKGMMPKETIEERVKRLKNATLPDVIHTSLDLYYNNLEDDERQQAYTARLEMWLSDNIHYRIVHARCKSFDEALTKIQEYEACLIAGKRTDGFEVYDREMPEARILEAEDKRRPFETRAEFTNFRDVLCKHDRVDKKGELTSEPRTVADLPKLNHGMTVLVPLKNENGEIKWTVDWFDYACMANDGKDVRFICIHDGYPGVYPLDPYNSFTIAFGKKLPQAYTLWLKKTIGDVKKYLKKNEEYR